MKLNIVFGAFFIFFLTLFLRPAIGSSLLLEGGEDRDTQKATGILSPSKPLKSQRKRKSKTLNSASAEALSMLLVPSSKSTSKYPTIGTSAALKEITGDKSSFKMPKIIFLKELLLLLEGKKVTISERVARLVFPEVSSEEISKIKKLTPQSAVLTKSTQANGAENIKEMSSKVPSGEYNLYDALQLIAPDVTLVIRFSKLKAKT